MFCINCDYEILLDFIVFFAVKMVCLTFFEYNVHKYMLTDTKNMISSTLQIFFEKNSKKIVYFCQNFYIFATDAERYTLTMKEKMKCSLKKAIQAV